MRIVLNLNVKEINGAIYQGVHQLAAYYNYICLQTVIKVDHSPFTEIMSKEPFLNVHIFMKYTFIILCYVIFINLHYSMFKIGTLNPIFF